MASLDKAAKRDKKMQKRRHGHRADKRPTDMQNSIIKRGKKAAAKATNAAKDLLGIKSPSKTYWGAGPVCDVCGAEATSGAMDLREIESQTEWAAFEPWGPPRYGCRLHHVRGSRIYRLKDMDYPTKAQTW